MWQGGNLFEAVCHGCEITCDGCVFVDGILTPTCKEALKHSTSAGGNVTLQNILIERGHWRATASSTEILACYHADACLGGVTGTSGYCFEGYEGPCALWHFNVGALRSNAGRLWDVEIRRVGALCAMYIVMSSMCSHWCTPMKMQTYDMFCPTAAVDTTTFRYLDKLEHYCYVP